MSATPGDTSHTSLQLETLMKLTDHAPDAMYCDSRSVLHVLGSARVASSV